MNITIAETIDELSGHTLKNHKHYSEKAKVFYQDRYAKIFTFLPKLDKDSLGLEIGLAGGILALALKKTYSLRKLYALEHPKTYALFTQKYISKLKVNNITVSKVDLQTNKLPWKDNYFDFIIFSEIMEHLVPASLPAIFMEIRRVLKQDGWLLVTTPNIASFLKRINLLVGKNPIEFDVDLHENGTYGHIREYTSSELVSILHNGGFKIQQFNYFMIDVKRSIYTRIENGISKIFPSLANNLVVIAGKN